MRLLVRNFFNTQAALFFRNFLGIKPKHFFLDHNDKNLSVSDAFFWRTDCNFKTLFKFTNLLSFFYKDNKSTIEIIFYNKNNKLLKKIIKKDILLSGEIIIDKNFLDGVEDYGIFYIFHRTEKVHNSIIRNSCYLGYSLNGNPPSFVHGNLISASKNFLGSNFKLGAVGKSFFQNKKYIVQNYFDDYDKTELLIHNSCDTQIFFSINGRNFQLNSNFSLIVDIGLDTKASIISNCYLLRPIVINYKSNYIDVYHG